LLKEVNIPQNNLSDEYLVGVIEAMRPRVSFISDFLNNSPYFFIAPSDYDNDVVKKRWSPDAGQHLKILISEFDKLENPQKTDYEKALHQAAENISNSIGSPIKEITSKLIHAVRLALTGVGGGPGLYDIIFLLGKNESIKRIETAIKIIKPVN
jgi:glutamyl-tRNA synthetase